MADDTLQTALIILSYAGSSLASQVAMLVIRNYLDNKPSGMQTLLDKVMIIFTRVVGICGAIKSLSLVVNEIYAPFSLPTAMISVILEYYIVAMTHLSMLLVSVTKYLSIYHGSLIEAFPEDRVIQGLKLTLLALPVLICTVEYTALSNFDDLSQFQQKYLGYQKPERTIEVTNKGLFFANLVMLTCLYVRIEMDAINVQDTTAGRLAKMVAWIKMFQVNHGQIQVSDSTYSMATFRYVALLCLPLFFYFWIWSLIGIPFIWWMLIVMTFFGTVLPAVFVLRHSGMRNTAKKMLFCRFQY